MPQFMDSLKELQKLRQDARNIERELQAEKMEFASRDGRITGVINGKMEFLGLEIDPALLEPGQRAALQKALLATLNNAVKQMQAKISRVMSSRMGLNLPGS